MEELKDVYLPGNVGPVSNVAVYGLRSSVRRAKLPMSTDPASLNAALTGGIERLAKSERGSGHDQWLTGVIVQFDLTFTIKAWTEAERYHWLDFISSQSTMHRIAKMDIAEACVKNVDARVIGVVEEKIRLWNEAPAEKKAEAYLNVLYNVPVGLRLTAGITTNYRQLKTVYAQRRDHRLPEWRRFCRFIETLPHADLITGKTGAAADA